jgi:hypothetical protein
MNEYTDDMLANLTLCSGCKKMNHFENDDRTCEKCKERGKIERKKLKEKIVLCKKEGCKFKKSKENNYCGIHQLCVFVDETTESNKKICYNYNRGCRAQLELDYDYSKCPECLEQERERDRNRRSSVREENKKVEETATVINTKFCTTCCKELHIDNFVGALSIITKTCMSCRENNKIHNLNRDKEHRNEVARINDAKPERIEVKQRWKEENYEKVAKYSMDSREKKIETLGVDEFWKLQAEQAKKWREKNPEKMVEANENKKNNRQINYSNYVRTAEYKGLKFEIKFEEYCDIVNKECHYCGVLQLKGFNGIDRKNQNEGYLLDNCVSCCKMCNYMKGSTSDETFIKRVEHILTYQKKINGRYYPECFADHFNSSFEEYRMRAIKKGFEFTITSDDFYNIINKNCYLCGKQNTRNHNNGVDRIDNTKGYILDNITACCGECNYIKKNFVLEELMNKFILIFEKHKNDFENERQYYFNNLITETPELNNTFNQNVSNELNKVDKKELNRTKQQRYRQRQIEKHGIESVREKIKEKVQNFRNNNNNIMKNENKLTEEEKREKNRLKKQKRREKLREKYGDEEYKKMRAKELADHRKKKKQQELEKNTDNL